MRQEARRVGSRRSAASEASDRRAQHSRARQPGATHKISLPLHTHRAMDMPRFAEVVVLPTPPLPEVTTMTLFSVASPFTSSASEKRGGGSLCLCEACCCWTLRWGTGFRCADTCIRAAGSSSSKVEVRAAPSSLSTVCLLDQWRPCCCLQLDLCIIQCFADALDIVRGSVQHATTPPALLLPTCCSGAAVLGCLVAARICGRPSAAEGLRAAT
jgi:hypothetical protein